MVRVYFSKDTHPGGKKGITITTSKRVSVPEGTTLMEAARKIKLPEIIDDNLPIVMGIIVCLIILSEPLTKVGLLL